jgi:hypothetical protein
MRITIRRTSTIFDTVFSDAEGEVATPDSATLTISYATDDWPLDGGDRSTATIDLASSDGITWTGTWNTGVSNPGIIFWFAEATTGGVTSAEDQGFYRLRGNLANLTFVNA